MSQTNLMMNAAQFDLPSLMGTIPAWFALALSVFSLVVAHRSLRISQEKETRAKADLYLYLQSGFFEVLPSGDRHYTFAVTLSNRSDSPTSIVMIELVLIAVTKEGWELRIRIPASSTSTLLSGHSLMSRQTTNGECHFHVAEKVLQSASFIAGHRFQVLDAGGEIFELNPGSLIKLKNEKT